MGTESSHSGGASPMRFAGFLFPSKNTPPVPWGGPLLPIFRGRSFLLVLNFGSPSLIQLVGERRENYLNGSQGRACTLCAKILSLFKCKKKLCYI